MADAKPVHEPRFCLAWLAAVGAMALMPAAGAAQACPPPPAVVRDVDVPRFYDDAAGSRVDARLKAAHEAAAAPLVAFLRHVSGKADAALRAGKSDRQQAAAACALAWLEAWARGDAWLGRVNRQGEYQRKWDLAGASLAYLKVKPFATAEQRHVIEAWLARVARAARAFFDDPGRRRNNHWYWLGLALAGTALAKGDAALWAEARRIATDAARDIRADGTLPMEMERGARALHYHAFSAMPLVVLAELAATRGEDFYALGNGALHRLVAVTLRGLAEPARFGSLTGVAQELGASSQGAGWLRLYAWRFPARTIPEVSPARSTDRRLGGDVEVLLAALRSSAGR
jgi:poly(beta-D-mannuronate) lyase